MPRPGCRVKCTVEHSRACKAAETGSAQRTCASAEWRNRCEGCRLIIGSWAPRLILKLNTASHCFMPKSEAPPPLPKLLLLELLVGAPPSTASLYSPLLPSHMCDDQPLRKKALPAPVGTSRHCRALFVSLLLLPCWLSSREKRELLGSKAGWAAVLP